MFKHRPSTMRREQLKFAILRTFCCAEFDCADDLRGFSEEDWSGVLTWLDINGIALYLLQQIQAARREDAVPRAVLAGLMERFVGNQGRCRSLLIEAAALSYWLNDAGIPHAVLKGITLSPESVPDPAYRWQSDLDFMIARDRVRIARHYLSRLGYVLHAETGSTLEFRAGQFAKIDIGQIYSRRPQRCLELHLVDPDSDILARRCVRQFGQYRLPALSSADIFVQQANHLVKHLCGEHTRLSWVLEFRRHMAARKSDAMFWRNVEMIAGSTGNAALSVAIGVRLVEDIFGSIEGQGEAAARLPDCVELWLQRYARKVLLSDGTGSKYYAFLNQALATHFGTGRRTTRSIFVPMRIPCLVPRPHGDEDFRALRSRFSANAEFFLRRLRFHVVEGIQIGVEAFSWKRAVKRMRRAGEGSSKRSLPAVTRAGCLVLLPLFLSALLSRGVAAQNPLDSPVTNAAETGTDSPPDTRLRDGNDARNTVLPAHELVRLLERNSQAMVECREALAQFLEQQGKPTAPEELTDEQMYEQIETSAQVRRVLTRFLLSRGYVSADEIAAAASTIGQFTSTPLLPGGPEGIVREPASQEIGGAYRLEQNPGSAFGSPVPVRPEQQASPQKNEQSQTRNITDEPRALRRPAPYNLLSLRDLYTQAPDPVEPLKRFGSDVFVLRGAGKEGRVPFADGAVSPDLPVGPDYILGPGDELSITVWGGITMSLMRAVNREGGVALPEAGLVQVAGLTLEKAQSVIAQALVTQYRNAQVAVTVARLRSIRVFVVGDVQRPGSYEIHSVASAVSALYAAGGPTAVGSLRTLKHFRNEKLIGEIDLYDFLLRGIKAEPDRLESGDTLLVPPVGRQVAIFGAVKRPAIYELRDEKSLADVLEDAGGVTAERALARITIERIEPDEGREEIGIGADPGEHPSRTRERLATFAVKDGDRIRIATVLPVDDRVVYLQGHVARPGKIAYRDNMRISDVLRSYSDMLPEPAATGEIVRLVAPDMHPETIEFDVADVLIGNSGLTLQPFDTVRVFGRYEQDAPTVTIQGEVQRPGNYPLFEGMRTSQLVRVAGGFKRDALLSRADLTSYEIVNGTRVSISRRDVAIGAVVLKDDRSADVQLKAGDVLTVHQLSGWNDVGASITIEGEVTHPGSYGFQQGEHLSDVLKRAGGFRDTAYAEGAVLTRPEVAALEEKSREELVRQIETSSASARMSSRTANTEQPATLQLIQQQQNEILEQLKSRHATGRLVIRITREVSEWQGTAADIEVRRGDVLRIPKRPGFVLVSGQVYNGSAITFTPGKSAEWYLQKAGGVTQIADRKHIFIVRANGEVVGRQSGAWFDRDILSTRLNAGDTVVVPQKIQGPSVAWRTLLATAQVAASITIAAAVAGL